jgi:hypothetical protein
MALKPLLVLAAGLLSASCVTTTPALGIRPVFPQYRPGETGGVRLTAPYGGILAQRGPCLGLLNGDLFTTMIWPETARLSFDERGLLLQDMRSGAAVRLGDWVSITGGPLPPGTQHALGEPVLTEQFALECARRPDLNRDGWIGIVNPGFRKGRAPRSS